MKECRTCGVLKPLTEFYKKSDNADKKQTHCKECSRMMIKDIYRRKRRKDAGPYLRLIYCPLNSWSKHSAFTRWEINEMLSSEYLAIGTRFLDDNSVFEVIQNGKNLDLMKV